jgi:hypothetical protein
MKRVGNSTLVVDQMGERYQIYEIEDLKAGDHLCCLYKNDEEHRTLLTSYMRFGLERNEKVFYIVDAHTSETVLDYLRDDGLLEHPCYQDHILDGSLSEIYPV